jgi:hypothetical protein
MKNEQFENDIADLDKLFPKLSVIDEYGEKFLKGQLDIVDTTDKLWEIYNVEIKGSEFYPQSFPKLFEVGNAFPKIADWHVNNDGSCCIDILPNELIICKNGFSVTDFITQFAIPYLANQTYRKREGYYLYGEYSHGIIGKIEFYQSKLKAKSFLELLKMLTLIIKGYKPNRTSSCPFCHKVKFRKCHRDVFQELENIKSFLVDDAWQLFYFFKIYPNYTLPKL